jgi:hypothetical protein
VTLLPVAPPERHLTRPEAIALLRQKLVSLCDSEHCACTTVARLGGFCGGFRNLSDAEFRGRFDWIAGKRPHATRAELEDLVSQYHLARQEVGGFAVCCDAETKEHCACDGWNAFDNAALSKFVREFTGLDVLVG